MRFMHIDKKQQLHLLRLKNKIPWQYKNKFCLYIPYKQDLLAL